MTFTDSIISVIAEVSGMFVSLFVLEGILYGLPVVIYAQVKIMKFHITNKQPKNKWIDNHEELKTKQFIKQMPLHICGGIYLSHKHHFQSNVVGQTYSVMLNLPVSFIAPKPPATFTRLSNPLALSMDKNIIER